MDRPRARLAIAAWQALSAAIVLAVVFGGLVLAVPTAKLTSDLAALLEACASAFRLQYATPGGSLAGSAGAFLALAVSVRAAYGLAVGSASAAQQRRRQRQVLALIARRDERLGALVVDHDIAAAYCLPGRRSQVVLTSGAMEALDEDELRAVLAHERAHLRGTTSPWPFRPRCSGRSRSSRPSGGRSARSPDSSS